MKYALKLTPHVIEQLQFGGVVVSSFAALARNSISAGPLTAGGSPYKLASPGRGGDRYGGRYGRKLQHFFFHLANSSPAQAIRSLSFSSTFFAIPQLEVSVHPGQLTTDRRHPTSL